MTQEYRASLDELCRLYAVYATGLLQFNRKPILPHMRQYSEWLLSLSHKTTLSLRGLNSNEIFEKAKIIVQGLEDTPAAAVAITIFKAMSCFPSLIAGRVNSIDLLLDEDSLSSINTYRWGKERLKIPYQLVFMKNREDRLETSILDLRLVPTCDFSVSEEVISSNHTSLEVPSALSGTNNSYIYTLAVRYESMLPAIETYNHPILQDAKSETELIKSHRYLLLDIGKSLYNQAAGENRLGQRFDVVVTDEDVLNTTEDVVESLRRMRELLLDDGLLAIQISEPSPGHWPRCIFGMLPHEAGGAFKEHRGSRGWEAELRAAGLRIVRGIEGKGMHNSQIVLAMASSDG